MLSVVKEHFPSVISQYLGVMFGSKHFILWSCGREDPGTQRNGMGGPVRGPAAHSPR